MQFGIVNGCGSKYLDPFSILLWLGPIHILWSVNVACCPCRHWLARFVFLLPFTFIPRSGRMSPIPWGVVRQDKFLNTPPSMPWHDLFSDPTHLQMTISFFSCTFTWIVIKWSAEKKPFYHKGASHFLNFGYKYAEFFCGKGSQQKFSRKTAPRWYWRAVSDFAQPPK